jgi:hypothetical protein
MVELITTPTYSVFTDSAINQQAKSGYVMIFVKIFGFYAHDQVIVGLHRQSTDWRVHISTSNGGRDRQQVECELQAHENFANGTLALVKFVKSIDMQELEDVFTTHQQLLTDQYEAERDADKPIGTDAAKVLLSRLKTEVYSFLELYERGTNGDKVVASVTISASGSYLNFGKRISHDNLIDIIAKCSDTITIY